MDDLMKLIAAHDQLGQQLSVSASQVERQRLERRHQILERARADLRTIWGQLRVMPDATNPNRIMCRLGDVTFSLNYGGPALDRCIIWGIEHNWADWDTVHSTHLTEAVLALYEHVHFQLWYILKHPRLCWNRVYLRRWIRRWHLRAGA